MSETPPSGGPPPVLQRVRSRPAPGEAPELTAAAAIAAALPYQGSLARDSPLRLLYLAAASSATGQLVLDAERGRYELHLKRGVIEHAASGAPEDGLGSLLVQRGVVAREAVEDAERVRADFGGDLVSALVSLKLLDPAQTYTILQEHGASVVARAVAARQGTCSWDPAGTAPPSSFPLGSRWGILCDAARRLDGLTVRQLLGDRAARVAARSGGRVELSQLKLTAHEARAATLFDGRSSALQLAAAHPSEADTILAVTLLLGEAELLAFGALAPVPEFRVPSGGGTPAPARPGGLLDAPRTAGTPDAVRPAGTAVALRGPVGAERAPIATPPHGEPVARIAVARPVSPTPPPVVSPPDTSAIVAFHQRLATSDHFEVLGVGREATAAQIKTTYFQLARRYHPDAAAAGEPPEIAKLRADIFARVGEAWRVLGNDCDRARYLEQLASGGAVEVDVSGILKAEEIFRKATVQVKARHYQAALAALEEAMALNPEDPEFGVWAAWVRFLLAEDRTAQHAASAAAIERALRTMPRCLPGYLFLAQMAKITGDLGAAERWLRRGLSIDPDAADLVRELKYLRK